MEFKISKETSVRVGEFPLEGNKWKSQAKVNQEASLQKVFKFKEDPTRMCGGFSWEALPKPWDIIFYVSILYITLAD